MIKIEKKIVGYSVAKADASAPAPAATSAPAAPQMMNELVSRPEALPGSTYKIRSPVLEHALYITVNDILLNAGTPHESRRPFEIFINSKNMEQFQWIVALTRIISAVFRKGGDSTFLVEELKGVFDPRGGYFKPGGVYMPSIVAEIGAVIEIHLKSIGVMADEGELSEAHKALIADKRAEHAHRSAASDNGAASVYPPDASLCAKCNQPAVIRMDGCMTCLNCGDSKCG